MEWAEETTAGNERITLFVAFNYGGRAEIVDAARSFEGGSEEEFRRHLYAPEMHDPDLLIRTSGEQRISNYLLWQCAYSELVFRDELWPDFTGRRWRPPWASTRRGSAASGRGPEDGRAARGGGGAPQPAAVQLPRSRRPLRRARRPGRRGAAQTRAAPTERRRGLRGETAKRVLVAIPWIAFAIAITVAGGLVFAIAMIAIGVLCPARVLRDDRGAAADRDRRLHRGRGAGPRRPLRHRLQRAAGPRRLLPAALRLRRRPQAPRRDRRLDGRHPARDRLDRHPAGPRGAAPRPAQPRRRRCWSTSWSAPSSPTPPPTRPAACSAATRSPPASRPTRPWRG